MFSKQLWVASILVLAVHAAAANEPLKPKRPRWDDIAIAKVKSMIAMEASGDFKWETIPWKTDPVDAVAEVKEKRKPIFLYFSLKGENGPAAAPC